MTDDSCSFSLGIKCAADREILSAAEQAGLKAVEIYTNDHWLANADHIIDRCKEYSFRYAIHAPVNGLRISELRDLAEAISAEVVVMYPLYWPDEWTQIVEAFEACSARVCVENIDGIMEPLKLVRRFGVGLCVDVEHLIQMVGGMIDFAFPGLLKQASHIHASGYRFGTEDWHTHLHHAPEQGARLIQMLKEVNYQGMLISEARVKDQTFEAFQCLNAFFNRVNQGQH